MRIAVKLPFQLGALLFAQEWSDWALRKRQLNVEPCLLFEAEITRCGNGTGATERERGLVDAQLRFGVEQFKFLDLRRRPFHLTKRAAGAFNEKLAFTRKKIRVHVAKLAAFIRRAAPEEIGVDDVDLADVDFERRFGLRTWHQLGIRKFAAIDKLRRGGSVSGLKMVNREIVDLPFGAPELGQIATRR